VILLAYVVAIPANEIVIPTVLMLTVLTAGIAGGSRGAGVMFELEVCAPRRDPNLMLFSCCAPRDGWTTCSPP
jgi:hypothetical protein